MAIRNQHWYSINEGISYPVDEKATGVDDAGMLIQNNIITDLYLRWPSTLGAYAFISSISVTKNLVSVTFLSSTTTAGDEFKPLAVISVARPVTEGRQYALNAQVDGVNGWIVFGSGANSATTYSARFATAQQTFLTVRAAKTYSPLAISGVKTIAAAGLLSDIVRLRGTAPVEIVGETRDIDGVLRTVAVVRLVDTSVEATRNNTTTQGATSVFRQFAGPCGARPDSNTCTKPPIEFVNSVAPDCDGLLTIEIKGFALAARLDGECGVVIDATVGLFDACLPPQIPNSAGLLPSQYTEQNIIPPEPPPEPPVEPLPSESLISVINLPYYEGFADGSADMFAPAAASGPWEVIITTGDTTRPSWLSQSLSDSLSIGDPIQYALASTSSATRNITLWQGFVVQSVFRRVLIHTRMRTGVIGAKHNTGLVLNYRPHATVAGLYEYHVVILNYDTQSLRIYRFNGLQLLSVITDVYVPGIKLDDWYSLAVTVLPGTTTEETSLYVELQGLTVPTISATVGPVLVNNYRSSTGYFGFYADKAISEFGYFYLEEVNG
jgi:hypothetical protein